MKSLILPIILLLAICNLVQAVPTSRVIEKPKWKVGDSWQVDVPVMCGIPMHESGQYTNYLITVSRTEKIF